MLLWSGFRTPLAFWSLDSRQEAELLVCSPDADSGGAAVALSQGAFPLTLLFLFGYLVLWMLFPGSSILLTVLCGPERLACLVPFRLAEGDVQ